MRAFFLTIAAGNDGEKVTAADSFFVDKFHDNVIVVGATDMKPQSPMRRLRGQRALFLNSSYNPDLVDLGAPGLDGAEH